MEIKSLCALHDIYKAIKDFEVRFQLKHSLSLNEGRLLCTLKSKEYTSSEIADLLDLSTSNTSKVIKSAEDKDLIKRTMGKDDKRQMFFTITETGLKKVKEIGCECKERVAAEELLKKIRNKETSNI